MNTNDIKKAVSTKTTEGENVTPETLDELSNGKGDDHDE